jgi:hypothetical protein
MGWNLAQALDGLMGREQVYRQGNGTHFVAACADDP